MASLLHGSCLCKATTFDIVDKDISPIICYCEHCTKLSGSIGSVIAVVKPENFKISGPVKVYVTEATDSGKPKSIHSCEQCSCLIYTQPKAMGDLLCVRSTLLDGEFPSLLNPSVEYYPEKRPGYCVLEIANQKS